MNNEKKLFLKALKSKFDEDPKQNHTDFYCFGGWKQSREKGSSMNTLKKLNKKGTSLSTTQT
jgi:methyl-coenzyme M reductase alpha subunit